MTVIFNETLQWFCRWPGCTCIQCIDSCHN